MAPLCTKWGIGLYIIMHMLNLQIMQKLHIGNSLLSDELAISQQQLGLLIFDILTCFVADVRDREPLAADDREPLVQRRPIQKPTSALL